MCFTVGIEEPECFSYELPKIVLRSRSRATVGRRVLNVALGPSGVVMATETETNELELVRWSTGTSHVVMKNFAPGPQDATPYMLHGASVGTGWIAQPSAKADCF